MLHIVYIYIYIYIYYSNDKQIDLACGGWNNYINPESKIKVTGAEISNPTILQHIH